MAWTASSMVRVDAAAPAPSAKPPRRFANPSANSARHAPAVVAERVEAVESPVVALCARCDAHHAPAARCDIGAVRKGTHAMNRRQLLCRGAATIPVIALGAGRVWAADDAATDDSAATELELISEDHATAKALAYVHDAAASPKRVTDEQKTQFCDNCIHYVQKEAAGPEPEDGRGTCALLPGFLVAAKGWCSVWVIARP